MIETISIYGPTLTLHRSDSKKTSGRYLGVTLHTVTTLSQATFASSAGDSCGTAWLCAKMLETPTWQNGL